MEGDQDFATKLYPKSRYSLGQTLYRELVGGGVGQVENCVILLAGPERVRLTAHKCVLQSVSDYFKLEIGGIDEENVFRLPENIGVQAAVSYIQAIYFEELESSLPLDVLLQIMTLCSLHLTGGVLEMSMDAVISKIDKENCLKILERTRDLKYCSRVGDAALACFQKNIEPLLEESGCWGRETWEDVLFIEGPNIIIQEILLFNKLYDWRNRDPASRERDFCKLVKLIRFPLMTNDEILDIDHTTGIFSDKEVADLLAYVQKRTKYGRRLTTFNTDPRRKKFAGSSDELAEVLGAAEDGDFIQLLEGEYWCSFACNAANLRIKGMGGGRTTLFTTETWMMTTVGVDWDRKYENNLQDGGEYKKHCDIFGTRNVLRGRDLLNCSLAFGLFGGCCTISSLTFDSPSNGFLYRESLTRGEGEDQISQQQGLEFIGCSVGVA